MAVLFFMTIPGLAVTLVALAALDRLGLWLHGRSGLPWYRDGHRLPGALVFDELQAVLYSSTRHTIDQRRAQFVLRDDEDDAAPAHVSVDLTRWRVVITRVPRSPAN